MAWPSVSTGQAIVASQFNSVVTAIQQWQGNVSAQGYSLTDVLSAGMRTANASWQEWQWIAAAGSSQANDTLALQVNARTSSGGSDSWSNILAMTTAGALVVSTATMFSGAVTFNGNVSTNAGILTVNTATNVNQSLAMLGSNGIFFQKSGGAFPTQRMYADSNGLFTLDSCATSNGWVGAISIGTDGTLTFKQPQGIAFGSNYQNFTPSVAPSGSMTASSTTINYAFWIRIGPLIHFAVQVSTTLGGTASGTLYLNSLPVSSFTGNTLVSLSAQITYGSYYTNLAAFIQSSSIALLMNGGGTFPLGSVVIWTSGSYRVA